MAANTAAGPRYHGQCTCERATCQRTAYYLQSGKALCGFCSKKGQRRPLPKDPNLQARLQTRYEQHALTVEASKEANAREGTRGAVHCCKMSMFQGQVPAYEDGYANIFPNYMHENRYGGVGMRSLSPKSMGPVEHPQPGLPPSKNLENFHQFSKWFPGETKQEFRDAQIKAFNDPEPHRHKPQAQVVKRGENKNIPRCWLWTRADGTEVEKTYIECRQFYCNYYERFAKEENDYGRLRKMLAEGYNLRMCGYDAYMPDTDKPIMSYYMDESRPFGHELVLYTMLVFENEDDWPWRKMKTEEF